MVRLTDTYNYRNPHACAEGKLLPIAYFSSLSVRRLMQTAQHTMTIRQLTINTAPTPTTIQIQNGRDACILPGEAGFGTYNSITAL